MTILSVRFYKKSFIISVIPVPLLEALLCLRVVGTVSLKNQFACTKPLVCQKYKRTMPFIYLSITGREPRNPARPLRPFRSSHPLRTLRPSHPRCPHPGVARISISG